MTGCSTIGISEALDLDAKITNYARYPHHVLITGERGTGKTTMARRIHAESPRARREFVNLNCAGFSENLLESELFGHERGAFTGATAPKAGLFEIAAGGTLFLDEIGELPILLQSKLLKAVEEKAIRRVGSNLERKVDVRIVAATSRNLADLVSRGLFRADLYDRLNVLTLETLPLRRLPAVALKVITDQLLREQPAVGRRDNFTLTAPATDAINRHDWPGNYREAINFATRLAVECAESDEIGAEDVERLLSEAGRAALTKNAEANSTDGVVVSFDDRERDLEIIYVKAAATVIRHVMNETGNSLRQAARRMGTSHTTLSRILQRYDQIRIPTSNEGSRADIAAAGAWA